MESQAMPDTTERSGISAEASNISEPETTTTSVRKPLLLYGRNQECEPHKDHWSIKDLQLLEPVSVDRWAVVSLPSVDMFSKKDLIAFCKDFYETAKRLGVKIVSPGIPDTTDDEQDGHPEVLTTSPAVYCNYYEYEETVDGFNRFFSSLPGLQLCIFVMLNERGPAYEYLKQAGYESGVCTCGVHMKFVRLEVKRKEQIKQQQQGLSAESRVASKSDAVAAQPDAVAAQPDAVAAQPDAVAAQRDAVAAQPDAVAAQPDAVAAQPDAVAAQPDAVAVQRDAVAAQPDAVAAQPDAVAAQRDAVATQRDAVAAQPDAVAAQHDAVAAQPDAVAAQRDAVAAQHDAVAAQPDAVAAQPDALAAQPDAVAAQPDAVAAQRDAVAAQPDAVAAQRDAVAAQPDAVAAQGDAIAAQPDAVAAQRDAVAAQPDAAAAQPDELEGVSSQDDMERQGAYVTVTNGRTPSTKTGTTATLDGSSGDNNAALNKADEASTASDDDDESRETITPPDGVDQSNDTAPSGNESNTSDTILLRCTFDRTRYIINNVLKMNMKLGGKNATLTESMKRTIFGPSTPRVMLVGAQVSSTNIRNQSNVPNLQLMFSSIVVSLEDSFSHYTARVTISEKKKKGTNHTRQKPKRNKEPGVGRAGVSMDQETEEQNEVTEEDKEKHQKKTKKRQKKKKKRRGPAVYSVPKLEEKFRDMLEMYRERNGGLMPEVIVYYRMNKFAKAVDSQILRNEYDTISTVCQQMTEHHRESENTDPPRIVVFDTPHIKKVLHIYTQHDFGGDSEATGNGETSAVSETVGNGETSAVSETVGNGETSGGGNGNEGRMTNGNSETNDDSITARRSSARGNRIENVSRLHHALQYLNGTSSEKVKLVQPLHYAENATTAALKIYRHHQSLIGTHEFSQEAAYIAEERVQQSNNMLFL